MDLMLRGVITNNFRRWTTTQFNQYSRVLGKRLYLGIELELAGVQSSASPQKGWERCFNTDELEISKIYSTKNPIELRKQIEEDWIFLNKTYGAKSMLGSMHINFVTEVHGTLKNHTKWLKYCGWHQDFVVMPEQGGEGNGRIEQTGFSNSLYPEDIAFQFLESSLRLNAMQSNTKKVEIKMPCNLIFSVVG